ncbi:MAG: GNAT family N-acetyltransferase [Tepidisphaera sp.]|nr:GNAT family N-acetyltransferase [Tepidisphaera sp.]
MSEKPPPGSPPAQGPAPAAVLPALLEHPDVLLRPLTPADARALFEVTPQDTFRYFLDWPVEWTLPAFEAWIASRLFKPTSCGMVVIDRRTGRIVGSSSYLDIDPVHRGVEIGFTWYTPEARGTRINPASKLLLLEHAFGPMFAGRCERVQLKCDGRNERSQRAIAKLGAVREGVLRKHRVLMDGYVRDTVMFSITREEWPRVREGLHNRLAEAGA